MYVVDNIIIDHTDYLHTHIGCNIGSGTIDHPLKVYLIYLYFLDVLDRLSHSFSFSFSQMLEIIIMIKLYKMLRLTMMAVHIIDYAESQKG